MFSEFHTAVENVSDTIRDRAESLNRPVIGVMPAYFPMELIEAVGGYAVQLWGNNLPIDNANESLQSYSCSVARSILELELRKVSHMVSAYVFTSLCDTLVNLREIYQGLFSKPTVVLSIPVTQTTSAKRIFLSSTIKNVIRDLESITGQKISQESLDTAVTVRGRTRELQRDLYTIRAKNPDLIRGYDFYTVIKAGSFLPGSDYNLMLENLLSELNSHLTKMYPPSENVNVVVSGMVFDPIHIFRLLDEAGINCIADDFANGWRTVSKSTLSTIDLAKGITEYLFTPAPCCCLFNPSMNRHSYLENLARSVKADGIIFWYVNFCEPDAFDKPQLINHLKSKRIPSISLDVELTMTNFETVKTRISAFREMLKG